jgi:hypothetical protein
VRAWRRRLVRSPLDGLDLPGPDGYLALLARDGTIYGRQARSGHLLWRVVAANRLSRPGVSAGPYLIVTPDASATLSAYRWQDGSLAGTYRLEQEGSIFVSAPVRIGPRLLLLVSRPPRAETRLLVLSMHTGEPAVLRVP